MDDQPDLFDRRPERSDALPRVDTAVDELIVVPFPLAARVGKVRDVARKLVATKTLKHAQHYRALVSEALRVHLRAKRVPAAFHVRELAAFWQAVDAEAARIVHAGHVRQPG